MNVLPREIIVSKVRYIFLIAAFNALFFSVLLVQKKGKALHDKILIFWLLYLGFYTSTYGLSAPQLFTGHPLLSAAFISLLLLHGPFLYLYIRSLMNQISGFTYSDIVHFLPFVLFNLFIIVASFFPEMAEKNRLDHSENDHCASSLFNFFLVLTALSGPVYFGRSLFLLKKLDINIFKNGDQEIYQVVEKYFFETLARLHRETESAPYTFYT